MAVVPRSETSLAEAPPPPPPPAGAPMAAPAEVSSKGTSRPRREMKKRSAPGATADKSRSYDMEEAEGEMSVGGAAGGMAAQAPAYSRQTRNLAALAAIAVQSGTTRYDLPAAVTIPDKSATMVMLMDQRVAGEVVGQSAL